MLLSQLISMKIHLSTKELYGLYLTMSLSWSLAEPLFLFTKPPNWLRHICNRPHSFDIDISSNLLQKVFAVHQEERSWPTEAVIRSEHKRTMGAGQMQLDEKKTQWTPYRAAHVCWHECMDRKPNGDMLRVTVIQLSPLCESFSWLLGVQENGDPELGLWGGWGGGAIRLLIRGWGSGGIKMCIGIDGSPTNAAHSSGKGFVELSCGNYSVLNALTKLHRWKCCKKEIQLSWRFLS